MKIFKRSAFVIATSMLIGTGLFTTPNNVAATTQDVDIIDESAISEEDYETIALSPNIDSYDVIVPSFGGSAFTSELARTGAGTQAINNNTAIGGDRTLFTSVYRYWGGRTQATIEREIRSGDRISLSYHADQNIIGADYQLRHRNTAFATVQVQSRGSWSPY